VTLLPPIFQNTGYATGYTNILLLIRDKKGSVRKEIIPYDVRNKSLPGRGFEPPHP